MLLPREHIYSSYSCSSVNCFHTSFQHCLLTVVPSNPDTHFPIYKHRCEAQGILMHDRAIPASSKESAGGYISRYSTKRGSILTILYLGSRHLMEISFLVSHLSQNRVLLTILWSWLSRKMRSVFLPCCHGHIYSFSLTYDYSGISVSWQTSIPEPFAVLASESLWTWYSSPNQDSHRDHGKGWSCSWLREGQAKSELTSLQILFTHWFSV